MNLIHFSAKIKSSSKGVMFLKSYLLYIFNYSKCIKFICEMDKDL